MLIKYIFYGGIIMTYLNTEDVYKLFEENGVAHLHVTDIDALPRALQTNSKLNAYKWYAEFDNGVSVKDKTGIAFAIDASEVESIVENLLCEHNDDFVSSLRIEKITIVSGDGFVIDNWWIENSQIHLFMVKVGNVTMKEFKEK